MNVISSSNTEYDLHRRQETNKWDGMGFLMQFSEHLPELPEDIIIVIGEFLDYQLDVDHIVWNWTYPSTRLRDFKFYYVEPRYYADWSEVHNTPCKEVHLLVGQTSRKHRKKMRLMNIQFLKAYEIIEGRLYYRSEEYYDSWEYQDDLDDENEERMREAWKDGWDD